MNACQHCEGTGRIPFGSFGAYYRDGEQYDAPGWEACGECAGTGHAIHVEHVYPPVPSREYDWRATFDGYDPGDPMGYGPTKEAAVADLLEAAQA